MYALSSDAAESPRATDPIPFEADAARMARAFEALARG
jgi:hypothetical protein